MIDVIFLKSWHPINCCIPTLYFQKLWICFCVQIPNNRHNYIFNLCNHVYTFIFFLSRTRQQSEQSLPLSSHFQQLVKVDKVFWSQVRDVIFLVCPGSFLRPLLTSHICLELFSFWRCLIGILTSVSDHMNKLLSLRGAVPQLWSLVDDWTHPFPNFDPSRHHGYFFFSGTAYCLWCWVRVVGQKMSSFVLRLSSVFTSTYQYTIDTGLPLKLPLWCTPAFTQESEMFKLPCLSFNI